MFSEMAGRIGLKFGGGKHSRGVAISFPTKKIEKKTYFLIFDYFYLSKLSRSESLTVGHTQMLSVRLSVCLSGLGPPKSQRWLDGFG